ncbi:MAG: hypothetical protein V1905_03770 [bacterium]
MSGFSSFGPGGPRREGDDREEKHLRDGQEVVRKPLSQGARRAIQGMSGGQEKVSSSMPEVASELRGLSLEELQQKERDLQHELTAVENKIKYNIRDAEAGLISHEKFTEISRQLSSQRTALFYQIEAIQKAIEAQKVWQEVPKVKE